MRYFAQMFIVVAIGVSVSMAADRNKTKDEGRGETAKVSIPIISSSTLSPSVVFQEGFNDTTFPPVGWQVINADQDTANDYWYQSTSVGGTGGPGPYEGAAFAADYYGTANGFYIDDYLVTPNTGGTPPGFVDSLTFWAASRLSSSGDYPDSLMVMVSTTNGDSASSFTINLEYFLVQKAVWIRHAYALPSSTTRYIAFRYLIYDGGPSGTNSDKVCIDDVQINRYSSTSVGNEHSSLPTNYALQQNYPNPFNPTTKIEFELKAAGFTTLKVYSLLGEEVATLMNEELQPGSYNAGFSAANVPSGIYFYRLTSGAFTATRRMLLLK